MHAVRSVARPKLSLAVPTSATKPVMLQLAIPMGASASSRATTLPSPSPLSATTRNTQLNQRASSTLQVPALARPAVKKSAKKVSFAEGPRIELVSPCPRDYYGEYVKMSREERRWRAS